MLKRHHRFFLSLLILRDAALVSIAFYLAYMCRFYLAGIAPRYHAIASVHESMAVALMLVVLWPLCGAANSLYVSRRSCGALRDIGDVCKTTALAFLLLVTVTYFVRDVRYSRAVLLLWATICCPLQIASRLLTRAVLNQLRKSGRNMRHVAVIGAGALLMQVVEALGQNGALGLRVAQTLPLRHPQDLQYTAALQALLARGALDQVIIALPLAYLPALEALMTCLSRHTVDVRLVPDFHPYMTLCGSIDELVGLPVINLQATPLYGWNKVFKRAFDLVAAAAGCVMVAPLLAAIALAIKLTTRGPVLYRQTRVGLDGRRFNILKFCTMGAAAEAHGARMAHAADPRCTRMGRLLRRLSLDELPQLFNVLAGDMSLVGPRPERPCFIETFVQQIPRYALRHKIKAGMTGWAQINGLRGNTSIAKRIELDLYYIENWSLALDCKILLRTVLGGFLSPHAY